MEKSETIDEMMERQIRGDYKSNPSTNNPELSKEIVADFINEERRENGTLITDSDKLKLGKAIIEYFGKKDLAEKIIQIQPLYYDENKIWWYWDKELIKWKITDETNILNFVDMLSIYNTVKSKERQEILEALKQVSRKNKPKEINKTWIQFKDLIYDIKTGKILKASPKYFVTNPIPWELHKEKFVNTPTIDKIFKEWVGEKYIKTLYEIISYCLIPDYPIHRLFCLIGSGLNGKSCFLRLLQNFIGKENITSTELDILLTSRFEVTRLHKKLVCIMGETNFAEMNKTSIIKKLTGQDVIGFEYKNKNPFEDENYAKILIATNNLPTTTDKTIGFYRRWLIIDFPNRFSEKKEILKDIPNEEYECLAVKCVGILKDLLDKKEFYNEGNIEERMKKYEDKSDPFEKFLKEFTDTEDPNSHIFKWEFLKIFNEWCKENRFREMSDRTIAKHMKERNIEDGRVFTDWFDGNIETKKQIRAWIGIRWKDKK